jgi:hypothetical protein
LLAFVASACGDSGQSVANPPAQEPPAIDPEDVPDPNDVLETCLLANGLEVERTGDVDSVSGAEAGVDLSGLDQDDPAVAAVIEECRQAATDSIDADAEGDAAANSAADAPSDAAARAGFDAYLQTFTSCMEARGYHPNVSDDPSVRIEGPGAVVEYGPGEQGSAGFANAERECGDDGREAERATQESVDGP